MRINHNIAALNTYRQLTINNASGSKAIEKLSSGLRINRAGDDAAGLAISEKMRAQIRGLEMASKNAQDGVSLIQTAEGALNETHSILQRMRELAVQAANDTNDDSDRAQLQEEVDALVNEIHRIATTTEFNGMTLLDGSLSDTSGSDGSDNRVTFHIGANAGQNLKLEIGDMGVGSTALNLGTVDENGVVTATVNIKTQTGADAAITTIQNAIDTVSTQRSKLGAAQNRLEHTIANLGTAAENLTAAESRIRDVDMAKEIMEFTKTSILTQAAQAMLAQANLQPQGVLQLLQ
jgi:flagellin